MKGGLTRGLSVTSRHTLIVTVWGTKEMQQREYTSNGKLIRFINLDDSIDYTQHAIELCTDQLVVCHHGYTQHRVLIVNSNGVIIKSYGGFEGSSKEQLNVPYCLAVDKINNVIFVADHYNNKVQLLSGTELTHLGDVTLSTRQLSHPLRLYFDELNSLLYIGEWKGRVLIVKTE